MTKWPVAGGDIETVTIAHGPYRAELITLGAALRGLEVPGRDGEMANITLGFRDLDEYRGAPRFYGAATGRYANRIAGASFELDDEVYRLPENDGDNNLHSGPLGFDQRFWKLLRHDAASAVFGYTSPDGENGFPGKLIVELEYRLDDDGLAIAFTATTDQPTVVNLTHHGYFNLAGEASGATILDHLLQIPASHFLAIADSIPLPGDPASVQGTPFDFRSPKPIGHDIGAGNDQLAAGHGYDHNYVLDGPSGTLRRVATVYDPGSGRVMEVHSTKPGVQLYTGNFLAGGAPGTGGVTYPARGGLCLEPQFFPDSPNRSDFPSARLDPGETYRHDIALRFRTATTKQEAFPG